MTMVYTWRMWSEQSRCIASCRESRLSLRERTFFRGAKDDSSGRLDPLCTQPLGEPAPC